MKFSSSGNYSNRDNIMAFWSSPCSFVTMAHLDQLIVLIFLLNTRNSYIYNQTFTMEHKNRRKT